MLLAMVGWLVPKVRRQAADAAIARIGTIGGFEAFDEAVNRLADNGFTAILPNILWGGAVFSTARPFPWSSKSRSEATRSAHVSLSAASTACI